MPLPIEARKHCTPQEYLALERQAPYKSEYYAGEIFALAGASRWHNLIVANVIGELRSQLKGRPCVTYPSGLRVKVDPAGLYTYPDVTVVCGEAHFEDAQQDTLLTPTLIVEVLSESTEAYDRGGKFAHYRKLESLQEYVLISQTKPLIEHYVRQPDHHWLFAEADKLTDTLHLPSIGCHLALSEVYDKVDLVRE
jgi:Uma2 family endonuclease